MILTFRVAGNPKPQGSKRGFVTKTGRVAMVEQAGQALKDWRQLITVVALNARITQHWEAYSDGPMAVELTFTFRKPLKPKYEQPAVRPDLDKLVRAVLDACTSAHVWIDDSQVTSLTATKTYGEPGVEVRVWKNP